MKKDKNKKHTLHPIPVYELGAIREYLEKMARKGWMFEGFHRNLFSFQKTAPKDVYFYVDVFEQGSWFDTRAEEETLDYVEYCENAGWNYVCTNGKFQIFYTENPNAIPIETDLKKRLSLIMQFTFWSDILLPLIMVLNGLFYIISGCYMLHQYPDMIFEVSGTQCFTAFVWITLGLVKLVQMVRLFDFWIRNLIRLHKGKDIYFHSLRTVDVYSLFNVFVSVGALILSIVGMAYIDAKLAIIFSLGMTLVLFVVAYFSSKTDRRKRSRKQNIKRMIVGTMAGVIIGCFLPILLVGYFLTGPLLGDDAQYTEIDENGDKVYYLYSQDEIPYTLEDAGYTFNDDGFRESSYIVTNGIISKDYSYTDSYCETIDGDWIYGIQYEKMEFRSKKWCAYWLQLLLENPENHLEERKDIADHWNSKTAYLRIYDYEGATEEDSELIILYDDYCYMVSMNMNDPKLVKKIFGSIS